jgi:hypothetical protein
MSVATSHRVRFNFTSGTTATGSWTKFYDPGGIDCPCVAGGSTNGAFNAFKM